MRWGRVFGAAVSFVTLTATCSPFSGTSSDANDASATNGGEGGSDAGNASGVTDANASADASPDANVSADAKATTDAGPPSMDAGACTVIASADFTGGKLPTGTPWQSAAFSGGTNSGVTVVPDNAGSQGYVMHTFIQLDAATTTAHAKLEANVMVGAPPDRVVLDYAMQLGSTFSMTGFYAEVGCTLYLDGNDELTIAHESGDAAITAHYGSLSSPPVVPELVPSMWFDVHVEASELTKTNAQAVVWTRPHGSSAPWQYVISGPIKPMPASSIVDMQCGTYFAQYKGSAPMIEVDITDVSLATCP
jgi:hypothetical protein